MLLQGVSRIEDESQFKKVGEIFRSLTALLREQSKIFAAAIEKPVWKLIAILRPRGFMLI